MIVLESLLPEHAVEMFAGLANPAGYRFLPDEPPSNLQTLRVRYDRQAAGSSPDGSEIWLNWIVRRCGSRNAVGYTQATITCGEALIGYHIFPSDWGQGLGTAAVQLTVNRLFERPDIQDVCALVDTRNHRSSSMIQKLGFQLERTIIGADHFKGSRSDEHEFVMSRSRWTQEDR